jgi:hypothetical protein
MSAWYVYEALALETEYCLIGLRRLAISIGRFKRIRRDVTVTGERCCRVVRISAHCRDDLRLQGLPFRPYRGFYLGLMIVRRPPILTGRKSRPLQVIYAAPHVAHEAW